MNALVQRLVRTCLAPSVFCLPVVRAQSPGLPPEWEVRKNLNALVEQVRKLKPILQGVKPEEWKGAPETYTKQWKSIMSELDYLIRSSGELSRQPDSLSLSLETLFRMQSMESMVGSLEEGIRTYQNPALADLLRGAVTNNAIHRETLREYIVQLAAAKEHELKIMDEEAQRCRAQLSRRPPPAKKTGDRAEPK